MDKKTQNEIRLNQVLSAFNEIQNGVRMGTLVVLGICEETQNSPEYRGKAIKLDRMIYESLTEKFD